ncbi:MAG: hypothetical protein KUG79_09165 [Pseudomonadales bacterium]|nr:hypothetical protein [Pseudomonadales bacterium]
MSRISGIKLAYVVSFVSFSLLMIAGSKPALADVKMLDKNSRAHLSTALTIADYTAFAEVVTGKMLSSRLVSGWGEKRPKLVLSALRNNTDDEGIRMADVYDRITEVVLNSGVARLMHVSADEFDYVVRSEMSSTRQYGEKGQELAFYKLELKMFTIEGEMVGQWSDVLPLARDKKKKKKGFFR